MLISCYAKLKEEEKISALIESVYEQTKQIFANLAAESTNAAGIATSNHHNHGHGSRALDIVNNYRAWALAGGAAAMGSMGLGGATSLMMAAGTGLKTSDPHFQHLQQQTQQQTHPHALFDPVQALQILQNAGYHGKCTTTTVLVYCQRLPCSHSLLCRLPILDIATRVALRYGQHDAYLKIQLAKEPPKYDDVLGYLAYLAFIAPQDDMINLLLTFGPALLAAKPRAFTQLLICLCSNTLEVLLSFEQFQVATGGLTAGSTTSSSTTTTNKKANTTLAIKPPGPHTGGHHLVDMPSFPTLLRILQGALECKLMTPPEYFLSLTDLLPLFADRPDAMFSLLDGIANATKNRLLPLKLWNTLLELYMSQYHKLRTKAGSLPEAPLITALSGVTVEALETKIMLILDAPNVSYDAAHVLLLCHIFGFEKGARYLLEKQNYIELVLLQMMAGRRSQEMYKLLRKEGTKDPELFAQVLKFFVQQTITNASSSSPPKRSQRQTSGGGGGGRAGGASGLDHEDDEDEEKRVERALIRREVNGDPDEDDDEDRRDGSDSGSDREGNDDDDPKWDVVKDLVDLIEKDGILSPIQVLSILSLNPDMPLHVVANYVQTTFSELSDSVLSIEMDVKEAKRKLDQVTHTSVAEIEMKKQQSALKKEQAASLRKQGNSNGRAFNPYEEDDDDDDDDDEEEKLRQLREEAERWQSIREQLIRSSKEHEAFYKELEQSSDGFSIVAGFFGRSLIFYDN